MPIVFVHGVNTRESPSYTAGLEVKRALFEKHLAGAQIGGKPLGAVGTVEFPYWGDLATTFAWQMASLPRGEMQALGGASEPALRVVLAAIRDALPGDITEEPLTALAKHDFERAVEILATLALDEAPEGLEKEVAEFAVAIQAYAEAEPLPSWLHTIATDEQLIGSLNLAVKQHDAIQAQGLGAVFNAISTAAKKLKKAAQGLAGKAVDKAGDFASTKLLGWTRESLNANLGRFFGDVFIYFDGRGDKDSPGEIPQRILTAFDRAAAAATAAGEPLVIVGHSLGGVLTFDLLGHYRPQLEVDLFVSVGSQVAHFEEIKLFHTSDETVKLGAKAPTPANIKRWINVYDEVDIFSYACAEVFDRVDVDARYDTKTYVVKAHGEYFKQARFYNRLRARIDELT